MIDYSTLLQSVLSVLIQVLLPVLVAYLIVVAKHWAAQIKAKVDSEQLYIAEDLARQLIHAADQMGLKGMLANIGAEKKAWALAELDKVLQVKGIHLDLNYLSSLIESIVRTELEHSDGGAG